LLGLLDEWSRLLADALLADREGCRRSGPVAAAGRIQVELTSGRLRADPLWTREHHLERCLTSSTHALIGGLTIGHPARSVRRT
jgi:hypothetical protein